VPVFAISAGKSLNDHWRTDQFGISASEAISSLYFPQRGEASLGRAAELAGVPVGQMMTILTEFGVESRIEHDDYLQGLAALRKTWG
jgi:hypothetical protein